MISVNMVEADVYEVVVGQRVSSELQRSAINALPTKRYIACTCPSLLPQAMWRHHDP